MNNKRKLPPAAMISGAVHWIEAFREKGKSIIAVGNSPRVSGETLTNIRAYLLKTGQ